MADVTLPARMEAGCVPAAMRGRAPALYRIPITLSLMGLLMIAIQAGQPLVGLASMVGVVATAAALCLRSMARRYAPAAILRDQGDAKMANGRYREARAFYERALAIVQRELPLGSPDVLSGNYNLAVVCSLLGDHDQAARCLDALLCGLGGRVPNPWSGRIAWLLRRIARHHSLHGRHHGAREAARLAIELVGEAPGADDCTVRSLVNDLGWAHQRAGAFEAAERSFRDALAIHEQYRDIVAMQAAPVGAGAQSQHSPYRAPSPHESPTSGGLDRAVAHSLVGLGWTLFELGRYAEAEAAFGRALMLASSSGGTEDAALRGEALRGQGTTAFETGRYTDADRCYRRAADALRADGAPPMISLLLDRAWLACVRGQDPRAEGLLLEAQRRLRADPGHLGFVGSLHCAWAELRRRQGNERDAHKHAQRAVVLAAEALAEHPRHASVLALAARVHVTRSELSAAERYGRRAIALLRASGLPQTHPRFAEVSIAMGELHAARGEWGAAEEAFVAALAVREMWVGTDHPALEEIFDGLRAVFEATGRSAEQVDRLRAGGGRPELRRADLAS